MWTGFSCSCKALRAFLGNTLKRHPGEQDEIVKIEKYFDELERAIKERKATILNELINECNNQSMQSSTPNSAN